MVFFLIGTPLVENSRAATMKEIRESVTKKGISEGGQVLLERDKYKMGNLDTLMFMNDKLIKLENNLESLLKKVDRQLLDINDQPTHKWEIKTQSGQLSCQKFIGKFKWSDSKYPRSYPLNKIVESFEGKMNNLENEVRQKANAYNETKATLNQTQQKQGNFLVKDLNDVLVEPHVKASDFLNTKYITTLVVIVPVSQILEFEDKYEELTNNVVPKSAKKLGVPQKDNLSLWRVSIFTLKMASHVDQALKEVEGKKPILKRDRDLTPSQEFIQACRDKLKMTAREFNFQSGLAEKRKGKRGELQTILAQRHKGLFDCCQTCFSEAYELYIHAKILRLIIEANMRFGKQQTIFYEINCLQGKQKIVQNELIDIFGDKQAQGLYGTKDEIDDTEDFFPFVYIPLLTF